MAETGEISGQISGPRLIVFAHGSRDPAWQGTFQALVRELRARHGKTAVSLAFLERCGPTLMDAIGEAAAEGVTRIQVLPMFFSSGGHVTRDLPSLIEEARSTFPGLEIDMLEAIGEHPTFVDFVSRIAKSALNPGES